MNQSCMTELLLQWIYACLHVQSDSYIDRIVYAIGVKTLHTEGGGECVWVEACWSGCGRHSLTRVSVVVRIRQVEWKLDHLYVVQENLHDRHAWLYINAEITDMCIVVFLWVAYVVHMLINLIMGVSQHTQELSIGSKGVSSVFKA